MEVKSKALVEVSLLKLKNAIELKSVQQATVTEYLEAVNVLLQNGEKREVETGETGAEEEEQSEENRKEEIKEYISELIRLLLDLEAFNFLTAFFTQDNLEKIEKLQDFKLNSLLAESWIALNQLTKAETLLQ